MPPVQVNPPDAPALPLDLCLEELTAEIVGHREASLIARVLLQIALILGNDRIVDWAEVISRTNLSKRTLQRLMDDNEFPSRVLLSGSRSGWRNSEVERWIRNRPRFIEPAG